MSEQRQRDEIWVDGGDVPVNTDEHNTSDELWVDWEKAFSTPEPQNQNNALHPPAPETEQKSESQPEDVVSQPLTLQEENAQRLDEMGKQEGGLFAEDVTRGLLPTQADVAERDDNIAIAQSATLTVLDAQRTDPDLYAQAARIAQERGISVDVMMIANDNKPARQRGLQRPIDFSKSIYEAPVTTRMCTNSHFARMSHDDLDNLKKIEGAFRIDYDAWREYLPASEKRSLAKSVLGALGDYTGGAIHDTGASLYGMYLLVDIAARKIDAIVRSEFGNEVADKFWYERGRFDPSYIWEDGSKGFMRIGQSMRSSKPGESFFSDLNFALGGASAQAALMYGTSGLSLAGRLATGFTTQAGLGATNMAETVKNDNAPQSAKDNAIVLGATVTGATGVFLPFEKPFQALGAPITSNAGRYFAGTLARGAGESSQETMENLLHHMIRVNLTNPDAKINANQMLYETMLAFSVGSVLGAPGAGRDVLAMPASVDRANGEKADGLPVAIEGEQAIINAVQDSHDSAVAQAEAHAQVLNQLNELAQSSKLRTRNPLEFEKLIQQVTNNSDLKVLYIDPYELMHSGLGDRLMRDSPEVASQFLEAYATGGQISLSLGEYMTKIASTDYAGQLAEHLRFDAAGVSLAQGRNNSQKAQESVQQKIESALSQKERDDAFNFSAGQVYLQILEEIETTERFAPEVDKTYAALVSNYYATQAKRLGITPEELFNRFPVQIQVAQNVEQNAFTQKELDHAKAEIQNAINIAAGQGHQQNTIAIAPVKDWLANIVKTHANVNISGFKHSIDTSAIRHIFNNHGNKKSETSRGLIAVTEQDFLSIPEIIGNPDKVILGTKNNIGREQVVYLKSMPDGSTLYLEEIRTGRGMLTAQSMRRYPATVHSSSILSTLLHTRPNPTSQGSPIVIDNPVISNTPPSYKMVLPTHMTAGMEEGDGQRIAYMYDGKDDVRALLLGQIEGKLLQDAQNAGLDIKCKN